MGSMRRWPKCSEADPVGRSRPAGVGRGAGLKGEVEEQACRGRWGSRPAGGGGGAGLQGDVGEVEEKPCSGRFGS